MFRIGHLGDINDAMLLGGLAATEMALALANVPHKKGGVQAAMDYLVSQHGAPQSRRRSKFSSLVPRKQMILMKLDPCLAGMGGFDCGHAGALVAASTRRTNSEITSSVDLRRFTLRRVTRARQYGDFHRAIAFLLRHLDLLHRAVLIVLALHDEHRHADIGEEFGDIPFAEFADRARRPFQPLKALSTSACQRASRARKSPVS